MDYGFRVVISSRFADIFKGNCSKAGLVTAVVSEATIEELWGLLEARPGVEITVDLDAATIEAGGRSFEFGIDDYTRYRLLNGLDDISLTLTHDEEITRFEASRPSYKPTTLPIRTAD